MNGGAGDLAGNLRGGLQDSYLRKQVHSQRNDKMSHLPQKLQGRDRKGKLDYCVERLINRTDYDPSKKYNLLVRKEHEIPEEMSHLENIDGDPLLKPDQHWEKSEPRRKFQLPLYRDTPRDKTSLQEIQGKKDFVEWFEEKYSDLDNGVYGAIQRNGKAQGVTTLFVLRFEAGSIVEWKQKSNTQERSSEGESSKYYAMPFYVKMVKNYVS